MRRKMSVLRERRLKLQAQVDLMGEIEEYVDFKTKEKKAIFEKRKLTLEIQLSTVVELIEEEAPEVDKRTSLKELTGSIDGDPTIHAFHEGDGLEAKDRDKTPGPEDYETIKPEDDPDSPEYKGDPA